FSQQRNRIVVEFAPAGGIEIEEQTGRVVIPAPPQIARQRPQPLLQGSNEPIQSSRFTHDRSDLRRCLAQHPTLVPAKNAGFHGLYYKNSLKNSAIDQGNAEERLVRVLAGIPEILKSGLLFHLFNRHRPPHPPHTAATRTAARGSPLIPISGRSLPLSPIQTIHSRACDEWHRQSRLQGAK